MPSKPQPPSEPPSVELDGDRVLIHELAVEGVLVELVRAAVADGRDPEVVVRQTLDVGAAIMLHGAAKGTVDAVGAEADRLLAVLNERSSRIEALGRMAEKVSAAKGLGWEGSLGPALDACLAPGDELEATGATRGIADDLVGDYVLTVSPRDTGGRVRKIVFEAKHRKQRPTVANALDELEQAKLNREAQVAVMLFPSKARSPLQGKPMRCYHGDRILAVYDEGEPGSELTLDVTCQLARTLAVAAERDDLTLDRHMLTERLNSLSNIIDRAVSIKRGISTAYRGLDSALEAYEKLAEEAMAVVLEVQDRL